MFYSHDILSSSEYGIATIWLVATVGKGTSRKVTRKAIQEVDVPRAVGSIIEPRAPLALRLQGNLLYGTARVFAQQCGYMLADAEKTQSDMRTFFRGVRTSELDPDAGKANPLDLMLPDDPTFELYTVIPSLDIFNTPTENLFKYSQASATSYSQFSPASLSQQNSTPRSQPLFGGFDLSPSSHSAGTGRLPDDLQGGKSLFAINVDHFNLRSESDPFGEEHLNYATDALITFDGDGNLISTLEQEPELPPLLNTASRPATATSLMESAKPSMNEVHLDHESGMILMDEPGLPDAEAFPVEKNRANDELPTTEIEDSGRATAKNKAAARRRIKPAISLDADSQLSKYEVREWNLNYCDIMEARRRERKTASLAAARQHAINFISGYGVSEVGKSSAFGGVSHPLALHFAGPALEALLQGHEPNSEAMQEPHGRRRTSEEAFGDDGEHQRRRVKQRPDEETEMGRNLQDDDGDGPMLGDDLAPEVGMEPISAMVERHSSTMPWSRPGSVVPGSSVRGYGSAQKPAPAPSPLFSRGRISTAIERHSDPAVASSEDFGQIQFQDDWSMAGPLPEPEDDIQVDTDFGGLATLDAASQQFLGYMTDHAQHEGTTKSPGSQAGSNARRWVKFEQLADPASHSRAVAAQAFLHVLSLATKNVIVVEQDGAAGIVPFGAIRVGVSSTVADAIMERSEATAL